MWYGSDFTSGELMIILRWMCRAARRGVRFPSGTASWLTCGDSHFWTGSLRRQRGRVITMLIRTAAAQVSGEHIVKSAAPFWFSSGAVGENQLSSFFYLNSWVWIRSHWISSSCGRFSHSGQIKKIFPFCPLACNVLIPLSTCIKSLLLYSIKFDNEKNF